MSDDDRRALVRSGGNPPARITPRPSIPSLPSSSGAFPWTPKYLARKDAEFLETDTRRILAQKAQSEAFTGLLESRIAAALVMAKIQSLPEIAQHQYDRGRAERQGEKNRWQHHARVAALGYERDETDALANLVRAQQRLADLQPAPPPPPEPPPAPPPSAPAGLSPDDVEDALSSLPEITPDTLKTISRILVGMLKEKRS